MTTREPVDINPDDLLPPWVARRATGSYAEVGAILPTRDGSKISNATVAASEYHTGGERWAIRIVTDAGNWLTLTGREASEFFHPPLYVRNGF